MKLQEFCVFEVVGGNYLYHATSVEGIKAILKTNSIIATVGPQTPTKAQTNLPTVSTTRDWNYAVGGPKSASTNIFHDVIIVLSRDKIEQNFKTLATSQSNIIKGLGLNPYMKSLPQNTDVRARQNAIGKYKLAPKISKHGEEFEEAIVVPKGNLPLGNVLIGFWINPKSEAMKIETLVNHPMRLNLIRPGVFDKQK